MDTEYMRLSIPRVASPKPCVGSAASVARQEYIMHIPDPTAEWSRCRADKRSVLPYHSAVHPKQLHGTNVHPWLVSLRRTLQCEMGQTDAG